MKTRMNELLITIHLIIGIVLVSAFAQQSRSDIPRFLLPTKFIDSSNTKIIERAKELTKECITDVEKAKVLFEFVRDSYNDTNCESYVASDVLECGGNSCRQRSILLAALCRAEGIPARLHLQKATIRDFRQRNGEVRDLTFAHGITGIYLEGNWRLYESVGNKDKWIAWTQDDKKESEMPVEFRPDRDCLFESDERIILETLPVYFADRTKEMIQLIEKIDSDQEDSLKYNIITGEKLLKKIKEGEGFVLIDCRPIDEYKTGHIPGAVNISMDSIGFGKDTLVKAAMENIIDKVGGKIYFILIDSETLYEYMPRSKIQEFIKYLPEDRNKEVIFYCRRPSCTRSPMAARWAMALGYKNVYRYEGSWQDWMDKKYPLE